jgi:hypothetical protein
MATLTAANAVLIITIPGLFNQPQVLQGFAADDIYDVDQIDMTEVVMGVDGILSGGFVFVPIKQTIALQPDSASNAIFESWAAAQTQIKDAYIANGRTTLQSVNRAYVSTKGFLTGHTPVPSAGKLLKPRKYTITWQSVVSVPN